MYARDTSKKIRSAFITRMQEGAFIGAFAPYGYQRDPSDRHRLVIDPVSGQIVQKIFRYAADGMPPVQIARVLNDKGILPPALYRCIQNPALHIEQYSKRKEWTASTISKMLQNVVYLGHMAQGKTTKASFKSNLVLSNPKEDWFVVQNTHEALISREIFDIAHEKRRKRTCGKKRYVQQYFFRDCQV